LAAAESYISAPISALIGHKREKVGDLRPKADPLSWGGGGMMEELFVYSKGEISIS